MTKMKAIVFDLDGCLVDAREGYLEQSVGQAFSQLGIDYTSEDARKLCIETHRDEFLAERFGLKDTREFWKLFVEYDVEHRMENTVLYNDLDVLDILKEKGIKIGIVTDSNSRAADIKVGLIGKEKFDSVVCTTLSRGFKPKPDPQGLLFCMHELGVTKEEACYVGDTQGDMETARNAGVRGIRINRDSLVTGPYIRNLHELSELMGY